MASGSSGLVRGCISNAIKQSPSGFPRSAKLQQVGESLVAKSAEKVDIFDEFSLKLVQFMRQDISSACKRLKCTNSKRSRLWSNFHRHRTDPKGFLILLWEKLLQDLEVATDRSSSSEEDPLLMQAVLRLVFEDCMAEYFLKEKERASATSSTSDQVVELTSDELNVLRYACGYVAHSLLKKFEKRKGTKYIACLGEMSVVGEGSNVLEYTEKWINLVNRGGLFPLNDEAFSFFVQVERCVQTYLPRHDDRESFRQDVLEEVQFFWAILSQEVSDPKEAHELLCEIVKLWVTVRGYSLTASWMEAYKKTEKKTVQKSTGLRKGLSGSSN